MSAAMNLWAPRIHTATRYPHHREPHTSPSNSTADPLTIPEADTLAVTKTETTNHARGKQPQVGP